MTHLDPDTLARLVDDSPTADEHRHLARCDTCATELKTLREQTEALGSLPDLRPPPGDWEVLQARMVSEGLIRWVGPGRSRLATTPPWMRAAAGVLLFLGGAAAGGLAVRGPAVAGLGAPAPGRDAFALAGQVSSPEEAAERVRLAERQYMDALVQYRQLVGAGDGEASPDPTTRFAAIEYLVRASQVALREAPADPFLNGILASTMAEREAQLRQISTASDDNWY